MSGLEFPKAVVVGGTGAVGSQVINHLLKCKRWSRVVAIGRRPAVAQEGLPEEVKARLEQDAGSAVAFRKVDLDYVAATARAAKAAGAKHLALVSSQGANSNVWANDWPIFHGLLYSQVKGLAEKATAAAGIPSTSIFRPGLLERGAAARGVEKVFKHIVSSIPVSGLGQLIVMDAIKAAERRVEQGGGAPAQAPKVYEMEELLKALKEGPRAPNPE